MAASIAITILALSATVALVSGLVIAVQRFLFITKSYRVLGEVESEWNYRMNGTKMRYYSVNFCLSNGQSARIRSRVTSRSKHPAVGRAVPVLILERSGKVNARIGTITELWFDVLVLLFIGIGSLLLLLVVHSAFAG